MSKTLMLCAALAALLGSFTVARAQRPPVVITVDRTPPADVTTTPPFRGIRPSVDVALLLDTSNSMDGLINQAKQQLWTIVQQFAKAKKDGQTPAMRVALFEYGNTRLPAAEGYIRQVVPLSDDLDKLSQALFALSTSGGDEYCGQVIDEALKRLDWSKETGGYKAIFIAGNEPFTQGSVDYRQACQRAIQIGVVVNTIHCGDRSVGISGMWQHGAQLAEGEFFNINQDRAVPVIRAPQDSIIIRLSGELNQTYMWYGTAAERREYAQNQVAQDANARQASESAAASRAAIKAGSSYSNRGRDLVDAMREDHSALDKLKVEELPEQLRELKPDAREQVVKDMSERRAALQKQINELSVERDAYIAAETKRLAQDGGAATLGEAMVTAINKQLSERGFATENGQ